MNKSYFQNLFQRNLIHKVVCQWRNQVHPRLLEHDFQGNDKYGKIWNHPDKCWKSKVRLGLEPKSTMLGGWGDWVASGSPFEQCQTSWFWGGSTSQHSGGIHFQISQTSFFLWEVPHCPLGFWTLDRGWHFNHDHSGHEANDRWWLPSGKLSHNSGKSPSFHRKTHYFDDHFQ